MIIPYLNYEISFTISKKTYFCIFLMMLFLIIANPGTYKIIGSFIDLKEFDDFESHHRHYLLFIHSIVYALLVYIALSIYNPFTSNSKLMHKPKFMHKPKIMHK
jgi:hypothetical protein